MRNYKNKQIKRTIINSTKQKLRKIQKERDKYIHNKNNKRKLEVNTQRKKKRETQ